jgi:hypothetical protein
MRVKVAVQTLSSSVADAIDYCEKILQLPQFSGASATVKFIRYIDKLFDLLNSSSPVCNTYKAPMRLSNKHKWEPFLQDVKHYISKLAVNKEGESILHSKRKVGFLGMIICILSVQDIFHRICDGINMHYLLTYKLSQDHLEMFFGCIRQRGGWNNNPSCRQFKAAYKRLVIRNELKSSLKGNCLDQCNIKILHVASTPSSKKQNYDFISNLPESAFTTALTDDEEDFLLQDDTRQMLAKERDKDNEYLILPDLPSLTEYCEKVVEYIGGYVVRKIVPSLRCEDCKCALYATDEEYSLIAFKNRGGLVDPSKDVVKICKLTEQCYREAQSPNLNSVIRRKIPLQVSMSARELNLFDSLASHVINLDPLNGHVNELVQAVSKCYLNLRLHHGTRVSNEENGVSSRSELSRLTINRHQKV